MFCHFRPFAEDNLPIDIRVIGLKQDLNHYKMNEFQARHIHEIIDVYVFDHNLHVSCAELTSSYELHKLYTVVELVDDEQLSDEQRDSIRDPIEQAPDDNDVVYVHTRSIDRVIEEHGNLDHLIHGLNSYCASHGEHESLAAAGRYLQGQLRRLSYAKTQGMMNAHDLVLSVDPDDYETKDLFREAAINAAIDYYRSNHPI